MTGPRRPTSVAVVLALLAGGVVALSSAAQAVPADGKLLYGLTSSNGLVEIRTGTGVGLPVAITGLDDDLVGIDVRPATGVIYGVGLRGLLGTDSLYTITPAGEATKVGDLDTPLDGTSFAVDVDPVEDVLRVVSSTGQNLRVDLATGGVLVDGAINGAGTPAVTAAAFTSPVVGATTLYDLDTDNNALSTQDPETGTLTPVVALTDGPVLAPGQQVGYDIDGADDQGFAVVTVDDVRGLYEVDPAATTAALSQVADAGTLTDVEDITVATPRVGFTSTTATVAETAGPVSLTLTRVGDTVDAQAVDYTLADGSASAADYDPTAGTAIFAAGSDTATVTVPISADALVEADETFTVTLTEAAGDDVVLLPAATATVTITDVPLPPSVISIAPAVGVNESAGTVSIAVTRDPSAQPATVGYTVTAGSAGAGDFVGTSGTVDFEGGEASELVTVGIVNDALVEPNETFTVTLSDPTGNAVLGASTVSTVTIVSEDVKAAAALGMLASTAVRAPVPVTVRGTLTVSGQPLAGAPVQLYYRHDASTPFTLARVLTTANDGTYFTQFPSSRHISWQAYYAGDSQRRAAASSQRRTLVYLSVARVSGQTTISRGQVAKLNGYIQPGSTRPRVVLQYLAANGRWTSLTGPIQVATNGRFTISRLYPYPGTYRLRVVGLRSALNEPSVTGAIPLRVL
jgi:hypothetical protein